MEKTVSRIIHDEKQIKHCYRWKMPDRLNNSNSLWEFAFHFFLETSGNIKKKFANKEKHTYSHLGWGNQHHKYMKLFQLFLSLLHLEWLIARLNDSMKWIFFTVWTTLNWPTQAFTVNSTSSPVNVSWAEKLTCPSIILPYVMAPLLYGVCM